MKKRGTSSVTSFGFSIAALVIFGIFVIAFAPTLRGTLSLFLSETNENVSPIEFYDNLVNELQKDNLDTNFLFSTNENTALVGFGKDQESFSGSCQSSTFTGLKKPIKCEG